MAEEISTQSFISAENTIMRMHAHPFAYLTYYIGGLFILSVSFWYGYAYTIVGLLVLIVSELLRRSDTFFILREGVSHNFSLFSVRSIFTGYDKIRTVTVAQGPVARLLGIGDVVMTTVGSDGGTVQFSGVRKPFEVAKLIQDRL